MAGSLFTLEGHKRKKLNQEYLVTAIAYEADSGVFESGGGAAGGFRAKVHCIPSETHFRPRRKTPWPVVPGAQTATVVGQKEGEISTDKYGRVQVHFPWNRARRPDKSADPPDDHCSCSVRVAQQWTGNGWGSLFIPRVGQEVVVEFLEGNPDRPLITGSVYNDRNKAPYELPGKASQSGWKTRSLQQGGEDEYNELRFDDDKGHEEINVQAQRDMNTTIKHDLTTSVGNDETHDVTGKLAVTVKEGDYTIDVKQGFMNVYVHKDNHTTQAKSIYCNADMEIVLTVMQSSISLKPEGIEIKFGANVIKLGPTGIELVGMPQVTLNS
jgi:type VI secretion system secreted protein VgrG